MFKRNVALNLNKNILKGYINIEKIAISILLINLKIINISRIITNKRKFLISKLLINKRFFLILCELESNIYIFCHF